VENLKKRNLARFVLQGIALLGILFGLFVLYFFVAMFFESMRPDFVLLCGGIVTSILVLAIGVYVIYISYLMLRGVTYAAIKPLGTLLALAFFSWSGPLTLSLARMLGEKGLGYLGAAAGIASLPLAIAVYYVFTRILTRLSKVARESGINSKNEPSEEKVKT
jgi:hypothetical protein